MFFKSHLPFTIFVIFSMSGGAKRLAKRINAESPSYARYSLKRTTPLILNCVAKSIQPTFKHEIFLDNWEN